MKHNPLSDFFYQLIALFLAIIIVHTVYVTIIRPGAQLVLEEQRALQSKGVAYDMDRSFYVVIKDYEQEACFVLMLWATAIMGRGRTRCRCACC